MGTLTGSASPEHLSTRTALEGSGAERRMARICSDAATGEAGPSWNPSPSRTASRIRNATPFLALSRSARVSGNAGGRTGPTEHGPGRPVVARQLDGTTLPPV